MKNLLVIEDEPEFSIAARNALQALHGWKIFFAASYEEAMEKLQAGVMVEQKVEKIDAVITDLFFPSQTDWRHELLLKLVKTGTHDLSQGMPTENPSGLAIAKWCHEHKLPFVIASHGDRHHDNLGKVRKHMFGKSFLDDQWTDPLPHLLVREGLQVDKRDPRIWLEAMERFS